MIRVLQSVKKTINSSLMAINSSHLCGGYYKGYGVGCQGWGR